MWIIKGREFEDDYIVIVIASISIKVLNRSQWMDRREIDCTKERIYENPPSSS